MVNRGSRWVDIKRKENIDPSKAVVVTLLAHRLEQIYNGFAIVAQRKLGAFDFVNLNRGLVDVLEVAKSQD